TASQLELWHRSLARHPLPASGCFQTSYPSVDWKRVACSTPPHVLYPLPASRRAKGASPQNVGNGADYTANTSPNLMSAGDGAFPQVTGVTEVRSVKNPKVGFHGLNGPNSYSLQLNSYLFSTSACGSIPNCLGWEQFIYENPPGSSSGKLFIQDWLEPAGSSGLSGCPPSAGWLYVDGACAQDSPYAVLIPNISITMLGSLSEIGAASSSGDSIYLIVGTAAYGLQNIQGDGITDLSAHWQGAEFNIVGNGGADIAKFNSDSTITVSLQTATGLTTAPRCPAHSGTTGEENSLRFVTAPANPPQLTYPSIEFTMTNVTGGGKQSCDRVKGT
ncbi:MAG: hypothetical protein JO104_01415, partial [Candidatus Eremiobacteraeota bacterium]|nr:hypothetical protein [Candidatus Eremiobacteraeota bacterium]